MRSLKTTALLSRSPIGSGLAFLVLTVLFLSTSFHAAFADVSDPITITANFTGRELTPTDRIELTLDRPLQSSEGRFAVLIGTTDASALFSNGSQGISYTPSLSPLPVGECVLTVYLIEPDGNWKMLAEFPMKVTAAAEISEPALASTSDSQPNGTPADPSAAGIEFTPTISINVKGQNQTRTFPRESAPERNPFTDIDGQSSLEFKVTRRNWVFSNKFDLVGVAARQNALRFGELQNEAPMIDLSSYLIELTRKRFKLNLGHVSFGSNRHLINSFSSRGIIATVPAGKQNELSFAAMNGTSIVGYDNFLGISRRDHSVLSTGFAREFFKERPNGLRVEFSVMRGSLLPLTNVNQGAVNDAEKSLGFGFRVQGSDTKQRLRYETGISRSRFTNPADPLLEQGQSVVAVKETWRTARFAEISFDFIQGMKLWKEKKLKLTGTYRHEEIEPLFRSIGASTQADKHQNQFEVTAAFGEMSFVYGNLRDRDNLAAIASILKTLNRRNNIGLAIPLNTFFTPAKPRKWLPQLSYTYDHVHQFGAAIPGNSDFTDPSQIPDQHSYAQAFNAQWQISDRLGFGYKYTRAFQDNRQPGRELADFRSSVHGITLATKPTTDIDLDLEFTREEQTNLEQPRTDRTFRIGARAVWRTPFIKNSAFSANLSTTVAGDTGNFNDTRNAEFDVQWAYRFTLGKKKFRKLETQFFIRYANRYGNTVDRLLFANAFNKTEAFNFGLSFNIL